MRGARVRAVGAGWLAVLCCCGVQARLALALAPASTSTDLYHPASKRSSNDSDYFNTDTAIDESSTTGNTEDSDGKRSGETVDRSGQAALAVVVGATPLVDSELSSTLAQSTASLHAFNEDNILPQLTKADSSAQISGLDDSLYNAGVTVQINNDVLPKALTQSSEASRVGYDPLHVNTQVSAQAQNTHSSEFIMPATQPDVFSQANIGRSSHYEPGFISADAYAFSSAESSHDQVEGGPSFLRRVIPKSELIDLQNILGTEHLITCSSEGELHTLQTPWKQCLVCACVRVRGAGAVRPVCASCAACAAPPPAGPPPLDVATVLDGALTPSVYPYPSQNVQPPAQIGAPTSCAPLPDGAPFEHPLNPCQICICQGQGQGSRPTEPYISCTKEPRCVIPSESVPLPSMTLPAVPVAAPLCQKFPKNVVFPHPTDVCQQCSCFERVSTFGVPELQLQCTPLQNCVEGPTLTAPGVIPPLEPHPRPTKPFPRPILESEPFPPPPPFENSMLPLDLTDIVQPRGESFPQRPSLPNDVVLVPYKPPPDTLNLVPYQEDQSQPVSPELIYQDIPSLVLSPASTLIPRPAEEPLPWPPITIPASPKRSYGPLLGPPPHESCQPYPPNTPFQHPWDECQVCRCSEHHELMHTSVEVNCYTKASCCIEPPILQGSLPGLPASQVQTIQVSEKPGQLVLLGTAGTTRTSQIAHFAKERIIYIEPRCRWRAPNKPFVVDCHVCECHSVYQYVVARCTHQPRCRPRLEDNAEAYASATFAIPMNGALSPPSTGGYQQALAQGFIGPGEFQPGLSNIPPGQAGNIVTVVAEAGSLGEGEQYQQNLLDGQSYEYQQMLNAAPQQVPLFPPPVFPQYDQKFPLGYFNNLFTSGPATPAQLMALNNHQGYSSKQIPYQRQSPFEKLSSVPLGYSLGLAEASASSHGGSVQQNPSPAYYGFPEYQASGPAVLQADTSNSGQQTQKSNGLYDNHAYTLPWSKRNEPFPPTYLSMNQQFYPAAQATASANAHTGFEENIYTKTNLPRSLFSTVNTLMRQHEYANSGNQIEASTKANAETLSSSYSPISNSYPYIPGVTNLYSTLTPVAGTTLYNPGASSGWDTTTLAYEQENSQTRALMQAMASAGGGQLTRAGRGQCAYAGDVYHRRCQACYCFTDDTTGDLYSLCSGTPCH